MISWDRVRELRREIGEENFSEVTNLFLEEVEETLNRLQTLPEAVDHESDLHLLKGSAFNLGFQALGALCREGEVSARSRRLGAEDIDRVANVYAASKRQFLSQGPLEI